MNASYVYADANGNMTAGAGRTIGYTAANMVASVGNNTTCHRFLYQGEHQRMQQLIYNTGCAYNGSVVSKTLYLHPDAAGDEGIALYTSLTAGLLSQQIANEPDASFEDGRYVRMLPTVIDMFHQHYAPTKGMR